MAEQRDTVWTVRSFDPSKGLYTVEGNISRDPLAPWPTVRCFYARELWPARLLDQIEAGQE